MDETKKEYVPVAEQKPEKCTTFIFSHPGLNVFKNRQALPPLRRPPGHPVRLCTGGQSPRGKSCPADRVSE
jgi:hypothetical protein